MERKHRTRAAVLAATAAALSCLGGLDCSSDFDPYNRLTSLRVLAIRSDPAVPAPGEVANLSALVYAPSPGDPGTDDPSLTYAWSWCPFPGPANQGYPCLVTEDQVAQVLPADLPVTLALGNDAGAALQNLMSSPQLQAAVCVDGLLGLPALDCTGGVPIQIKLTVATATDKVESVFRTRWGLVPGDANANPELTALSLVVGDAAQTIDATNSGAVTLQRAVENQLALAPEIVAQSETYLGNDDSGQSAMLQERLFVSWFVETGDTKQASTGYIAGMTDPAVLAHDSWTPALEKKYPLDTARIFLVIRDSRAGVGWSAGQVNLAPDPPGAAP